MTTTSEGAKRRRGRLRDDEKEMGTHTPSRPAVDPEVKARYMLAQIKRMERLMKPLGVKVEIASLDDLKAFVNRLIQLQTDKRLEPHEMRTLIDACEVLRKIYQPSDLEERVDELLKETTTLRESVAEFRKSGSL